MKPWKKFPHDNTTFRFAGEDLLVAWPRLHRGDCARFPDARWVRQCIDKAPASASDEFEGDCAALAERIQDAWRCFHSGEFQRSLELSERCGGLAHAPANKASGIYATYLETDEARKQACFLAAAERAEAAIEEFPGDPNSHYLHAFNLGRYSQSISVIKALRQGIGGKVQASLKATLALQPEHAEAHTAFGVYHAEIIGKVGSLIGGMTYGASADEALRHFEKALELTPDSPIAHIEYGNGLYLLYGDDRLDEVTELYVRASELEPADAMEKLDVEAALAEFE